MAKENPNVVPIIHSSKDDRGVDRLIENLCPQFGGLHFWADHREIQAGEIWSDEIMCAAGKATMYCIYGTEAAFLSAWVQREIGIALLRNKTHRCPILILAFDPAQIPADLCQFQYIDFRAFERGMKTLVRNLSNRVNSAPRAA